IAQTITTFKQPYAVLTDANGQIEEYAGVTCQPWSTHYPMLEYFRQLKVDDGLSAIATAMAMFAADLNHWYEEGVCPMDCLDLQKHASLLMYRLFAWYHQRTTTQHDVVGRGSTAADAVDRSICLALLIFMVTATEPNAGSFGPRLSKTVFALRQSLEQVGKRQWEQTQDLLVWILAMGALGENSLPRAYKPLRGDHRTSFFREHMILAMESESLDQRPCIAHILQRMATCLWVPSVFNERVRVLWEYMDLNGAADVEPEEMGIAEADRVEDEYALGRSTTLRFFTADKARD
ncbi:hypothetical protein ACEQ8H_006387, partial [Pleosporales sp. CAS-2024a]